ncbi:uracil-DNA glycosylase superfamily protein [Sphingomonas sp. MM-1]|uniref:uracil-DNA glycosylase n=1 Tax=Sphingomonas sp. MM-1 TaxID=745310 RepID=UPI0002C0C530|nr:uracil-DNA glycosylase [Sphingomonas sp. MM-1]AGH50917.1 uracil-DNA glycosylase superfamily protein [Sphingomonas sp. MM-1]
MSDTALRGEFLSTIDWWREAGIDTLVEEEARDWLAAPRPAPAPAASPAAATAEAPASVPATLDAIAAFYAEDAMFGRPDGRLLPQGDAASGLMLLADQPEPGDDEAGQIIGGEVGRLFDRMLAAIGRDRASIYLTTMTPVRVPGGRPESAALERWTEIARTHVSIAAPRLLLLLGDAATRAFIGTSLADARGRVHSLNLGGHNVRAMATFHPRFLLQQPARKADAWRDLRLLLEELGQ